MPRDFERKPKQSPASAGERRGHIKVLDRAGLQRRSCECCAVVRAEYDRLLADGKT